MPAKAVLGAWAESDQTVGAASITINMANGNVQQVTLSATAVTSSSITNPATGMLLVLRIKQDGTGGRTWAWPANVVWCGAGVAPTVVAAANAETTVALEYDGTNWQEIARSRYDSGWITPSFTNGWVDSGGSATVRYRRVDDRVYMRGQVGSGTNATACFSLPAAYAPASGFPAFICATSSGAGAYVWVNGTTGPVCPSGSINIDPIQYSAV
jgi:hypothetical protein